MKIADEEREHFLNPQKVADLNSEFERLDLGVEEAHSTVFDGDVVQRNKKAKVRLQAFLVHLHGGLSFSLK